MKPIIASDRKVQNIYQTEFEPLEPKLTGEQGTSILQLNRSKPDSTGFFIYKMEPGASSAPHRHVGAEEFLIIEGELIDHDGYVYRAGDLVMLAHGTEHNSHSKTGCLIAVYAEGFENT